MKLKLTTLLFLSYFTAFSQSQSVKNEADTLKAQALQTVEIIGRLKKDYNSEYSFGQPKLRQEPRTFRNPLAA